MQEVLGGKFDARRRVYVLDKTKTEGSARVEVPVTRRAASGQLGHLDTVTGYHCGPTRGKVSCDH